MPLLPLLPLPPQITYDASPHGDVVVTCLGAAYVLRGLSQVASRETGPCVMARAADSNIRTFFIPCPPDISMLPYIGYALREQNRTIIVDEPAVNAVEITLERADDPLRTERYLGDCHFDYVSVHALKLSPGSADPPARRYLDSLKAVALENDAASVSDHLGFTRNGDGGSELGHFAPVPFTPAALDAATHNIDYIQRYFYPLHFYIENIAYLFRWTGTMSEATFLSRLLRRTGCGWLLDVTNVYANARNFGFDGYEFISEVMPSASRVQMHLAGGYFDPQANRYIDSHSEPIPDPVWDLYRFAVQQAGDKLDAVFIERDQNFPDETGWRTEVRRARRVAEGVNLATALYGT